MQQTSVDILELAETLLCGTSCTDTLLARQISTTLDVARRTRRNAPSIEDLSRALETVQWDFGETLVSVQVPPPPPPPPPPLRVTCNVTCVVCNRACVDIGDDCFEFTLSHAPEVSIVACAVCIFNDIGSHSSPGTLPHGIALVYHR